MKAIFAMLFLSFILIGYNNCSFQSDSGDRNLSSSDNFRDNARSPSSMSRAVPKLGGNFSAPYRLLTGQEVENSLSLIFSISFDEITSGKLLPDTSGDIFENSQFNISISQPHMDGFKEIADLVVGKVTANNSSLLKKMFPCLVAPGSKNLCKIEIIEYFAPLFLRREISASQKEIYNQFLSNSLVVFEGTTLIDRVPLFLSALTQSTSFIVRKEAGSEEDDAYYLNQFEIASRLSFFVTGAGPDLELLNLAKNNQLKDPEVRRAQTVRLLSTELGKKHIIDMNKQLFRIKNVKSDDSVRADLEKESELLIEDIIFTKNRPWKELFVADGTFINRNLASNYNMTGPNNNSLFEFVKYPDANRTGILSHGSFLSQGYAGEAENTSPIRRGLQIVEDILCRHLPPPSDVDVDNDPAGDHPNLCNIEARKATTLKPGGQCTTCHMFMEPLGLSFERFNLLGQYRSVEKDRNNCTTIEDGLLSGQKFSNMRELGNLMYQEPDLDTCLVSRISEYAFGAELSPNHVAAMLEEMPDYTLDKKFKSLVTDLASSAQFIRRDK